tara:strand:+ start:297 stop:416 length:120 start_codon:yes stop_codon:yes gene_type:complete
MKVSTKELIFSNIFLKPPTDHHLAMKVAGLVGAEWHIIK